MVLVIADDITGAAELAGIALRYELRVSISATIPAPLAADVLVVYTNTRSMPEDEAVSRMAGLMQQAIPLQPALFYKKTDSVLRGHVLAEMQAQMAVAGYTKGLLIPVNPSLGRTIKDGHYFIHGQRVHEAGFASDPEFPIRSSRIQDMLRVQDGSVRVVTKNEDLPDTGIAVGEAQTAADVTEWAAVSGDGVLFAGGASFFDALLQAKVKSRAKNERQKPALSFPFLFVSGTTYPKNKERIKTLPHLASFMPEAVFLQPAAADSDVSAWVKDAVGLLQKHGAVIMAIGEQNGKTDTHHLREKIGEAVETLLQQANVKEVVIEGGATAFSILEKLGWQSFVPTEEWAQGVVRMRVVEKAAIHLTIKPGSYEWPAAWNLTT